MIVNRTNSGEVTSSGIVKEKTFGIKITGKTFKLISDTLYENKIGSIVRELSCNAYDSHRMANKADVPFEIHLPTVYEPTFYVKDFGLGMSPETIEQVYSTYFESTKDASNSEIGGMGIGGKTPFSYVNNFSIISVFNGMKYFYSAMIGEDDIPVISMFSSEVSNEKNGVTIEMNVKSDDYRRFAREVTEQLKFFTVKPTLLNNINNVKFPEIRIIEDFGKFKKIDGVQGVWIVQGGVGYPLDASQFSDKIKNKNNLEFFNLFEDAIMEFDIGEIEVTISREGISYSTHTVNNLENFVTKYAPIIYNQTVDVIKKLPNDWARLCYLNDTHNNRRFASIAGLTFGKGGNTGDQKHKIFGNGNNLYTITMTDDWRDKLGNKKFNICSFDKSKLSRSYFNTAELVLVPDSKTRIFIRDTTKSAIGKLKNYVSENYTSQVYLVEHPEGSSKVDDSFIKMITSTFAGAEVIMASSLPELSKTSYNNVNRGPVVVYCFNCPKTSQTFDHESFYHWNKIYDEEEIESGYFLEFNRFPHYGLNSYTDMDILKQVVDAGLMDKPIYIIKDTKADLLKNNPNFSCPIKKAKEIVDEHQKKVLKSENIVKRYKLAKLLQNCVKDVVGSPLANLSFSENDIVRLPKNSLPTRVNRMYSLTKRYVDKVDKKISNEPNKLIRKFLQNMIMTAGSPNDTVSKIVNNDDIQQFYAKYPMLHELSKSNTYGRAQDGRSKNITDYILMIDNLTETQYNQ